MKALVLDPGKVTGAALVEWTDVEPLTVLWTRSIPGGCEGFVEWWRSLPRHRSLSGKEFSIVICELFEIDGTVTGVWSAEIQGAIKALWGEQTIWQRRDDKAALLPTEPARRAWFNRRGLRFKTSHELDSVTHATVFLKRLHHEPTLRHWWPKPVAP